MNNNLNFNYVRKSLTHQNSNTNHFSHNSLKSKVLQVLNGFTTENIDTIASIGVQLFEHQKSLYKKYESSNNIQKKNISYNGWTRSKKFSTISMSSETINIPTGKFDLLKLRKNKEGIVKEPTKTDFINLYQEYLISLKFDMFRKPIKEFSTESTESRQDRIMTNLTGLTQKIRVYTGTGGNKVKSLKDKHKNELNKLKLKHNNQLLKLKNKQKKELKSLKKNAIN